MNGKCHVMQDGPVDGISSLKFAPQSNNLLVASWDSKLRLYNAEENALLSSFDLNGACLDCTFIDSSAGLCGGLDKEVKLFDFNVGTNFALGIHEKPVRCVDYNSMYNTAVSGGWDGWLCSWDIRTARSSGMGTGTPAGFAQLPSKIFTLDATVDGKVVVGTSNRGIYIYDLRNLQAPEREFKSPLKYQTRILRSFPDGTGFAIGSIEGRVAIEYLDPSPDVQAKKYAFKCHRNGNLVYPINSIAYHPVFGTFATGGCDGMVYVWDGAKKKRISHIGTCPASIAAMDFNHDGSLLAVASSYTFEEGEKDNAPPDEIYIKAIVEKEVKSKNKKQH